MSIVRYIDKNQTSPPFRSFSHYLNALKRPLVIAFDKEIDIDGHPVPANVSQQVLKLHLK